MVKPVSEYESESESEAESKSGVEVSAVSGSGRSVGGGGGGWMSAMLTVSVDCELLDADMEGQLIGWSTRGLTLSSGSCKAVRLFNRAQHGLMTYDGVV